MSCQGQLAKPQVRRWTAVFFALVVAGLGFVQAVHMHDVLAGGTSPASHCSLCVAAHNAAVVTAVSSAAAPVVESTALVIPAPQSTSRLQLGTSFIRPPPSNL
jgi:hypothetical protein